MKLSNKFFKEHPLKDYSAAQIAHFQMFFEHSEEIQAKIRQFIKEQISPERQALLELEAEQIASADSAEEIINIMRKMQEMQNRNLLCDKVLSNQDKYLPAITKRFYRIKMDKFIETAAVIIYHSDIKYLQDLYQNYNAIQFPYAQAMICLLTAMREFENNDEFLMNEFDKFKKYYPEDTYSEFPLLALYITNGKF